ncbi:uncharacterized protein LOC116432774 isoform X2 [Nomia melanderi]|uniref:uncharacterized protein LOC116432774 isoform X2 n=1 Tax=Nomia melanderi TaxID=2448451 RepID=UPI00130449BC|nr:uncharacterized protein LOC116432774 [Nomia melanderi]
MSTYRGRGRGRGWIQDDKDPPPKPGNLLRTEDADCNTNLVDIVNSVTDENLEQQAEEFIKLIDSDFKETYDKLHECARNDKEFGQKLLRLVRRSRTHPQAECAKSMGIFKYVINTVQNNYEERIKIRQENTVQFYNDIYLLSELVTYFTSGCMMSCVLGAMLDYMEMLLETASAEDIRMFTEQITVHGKLIGATHKIKMDELMIMARQVLIKNDFSPTSRQMLLYAIDLVNQNFEPLPKNLQEFYELQLGKNFIQQ